ncbi:MAG: NHL repeat-containing protein [Planctomycetota bacterium]|jgi:sugar lactone lactonase YvrE
MKHLTKSQTAAKLTLLLIFTTLLLTSTGCGLKIPKIAVNLPEKHNTVDGMTLAPDNNIYISCNNWNDTSYPAKILKLSPANNISEFYTLPLHPDTGKVNPLGIDIGPDGNFYIADNQAPYSTDYKSRLLRIVTKNGKPVGCEVVVTGLVLANGVACTDKYVYVAETQIDPDARPLPSGVYRFTYDELESGIVELEPDGKDKHLIAKLMTNNPDQAFGANGIDTDKDGNVFVGNFGDAQIIKFTLGKDGQVHTKELFTENQGIESVDGFKIHPKTGDIYIADFLGNAVHEVDIKSGKVRTLVKNDNTDGQGGLLDRPSEVCIRGNKLYISNIDLPAAGNEYDDVHLISIITLDPEFLDWLYIK